MIELYNDDCFNVLETLEDESIDMILVDPPYGMTSNKWDSIIDFERMWKELKRVVKEDSAIVFTSSQPFTSLLVCSHLKGFKCEWIWKKNRGSNFGSVRFMPMKEHESVLVFSKSGKKTRYYPIRQPRAEGGKARAKYPQKGSKSSNNYNNMEHLEYFEVDPDTRCPSSVQMFNTQVGHHPTQKPIALLEYLIKTYTLEGETVLDFTMGSGSTGVAAKNTNRSFIGVELEEKYFKIAKDRIEEGDISHDY